MLRVARMVASEIRDLSAIATEENYVVLGLTYAASSDFLYLSST